MDCERVAELLPWLKNGTLGGPEQQLVREHLAACQKCQREAVETEFAWAVHQQHVPAEALVSLAYESPLAAAEHSLFQRHLSACPKCAEQLDLVRESRRLETDEDKKESGVVVPFVPSHAGSWQRARVWQYGAVAATLLFVIAAGGWFRSWQRARSPQVNEPGQEQALRARLAGLEAENERLRQAEAQLNQQQNKSGDEIAKLRSEIQEAQGKLARAQEQTRNELARMQATGKGGGSPQINVLAVDIYPLGMIQRDAGQTTNVLRITGDVKAVTLMLHSQAPSSLPSYSVEIANSRRVVWRAQGLRRNPTNDYTISVPANYLQLGRHTINIYGTGEGRRTKVESYEIEVKRD
jgi:hypothetical protein